MTSYSSYLNIVGFLIITIIYYIALKPRLTLETASQPSQYAAFIKTNYTSSAIYLCLATMVQFILNSVLISSVCGGSIKENIGAAGLMTFVPWVLIFGAVIVAISIYPSFKTAFSDVVGYFWIATSANKILSELLVDKEIHSKIETDTTLTAEQKNEMQSSADAILKICGNMSILINQIVPTNFIQYWNILKPLMKPKYQAADGAEPLQKLKTELFEIVVTRDNVGEAMWYIYTGLIITSLVQLKLTLRGCSKSAATMESEYQLFLADEQQSKQQKTTATSTVYTLS